MSRYARQIVLPEVGLEGQERLRHARVLIVGVGGLGAPAAIYLAAAGVGTIGLVDADEVALDNLHRQIMYTTGEVGELKVEAAARRLRAMNSEIEVTPHALNLTPENARALIEPYDMVLDGTDNFAARYAINDACVQLGRPNVHASVYQFQGQVSVFSTRGGPCYRCLFPTPPGPGEAPSCAEAGVLGALPGVLGTMQAVEALKLILGVGKPLIGRLLMVDAFAMRFQEIASARNPACPCCGVSSQRSAPAMIQTCTARAVARTDSNGILEVLAPDLASELAGPRPPVLLDVREPHELMVSTLPGAIHIPIGEIPLRLGELDSSRPTVVFCRSGARSASVAAYLAARGFKDVRNLADGINGWARTVDRKLTLY
ncbi:MAG: HesA/MoeB/ThiF family protein [Fimbriimonas ginsengisoli]|uniref:HesA/MoeB/ThiF family protein n=1 Tax=Fimbriimonas ginsengisoli TaxID=1005039 RepID=A0A931LWA5_FIMGI|nr:HesA/MoeB/ThiF family protein [Fimbriimonas ginsengisoli]